MSGFLGKIFTWRNAALFVSSIALFVVLIHVYTAVLGFELPKTMYLRMQNKSLKLEAQVLDRQLDEYEERLGRMEVRDEEIYRSIFGLNSISSDVRNAGYLGDDSGHDSNHLDRAGYVKNLLTRSDVLIKKAYVQGKSYDEIELMLQSADDMSTSMPAICPVVLEKGKAHISSPFGARMHPTLGYVRMHKGVDIALGKGSPVYCTGDGMIEDICIKMDGYGRQVVVNHGFGYKTRYAHLDKVLVTEGMKVKRGEQIATVGNTGTSSGPHLHYEVLYKGNNVNPVNYFDRDMPVEQYMDMVESVSETTGSMYIHPMHRM